MASGTVPVISTGADAPLSALERTIASFGRHLPAGSAFEFSLPGRPCRRTGEGDVRFRLVFENEKAVAALKSLDEMRIGNAYLAGDLSIEGDLTAMLDLRK